jgi:mono/diheme cytochrome c family protein
MDTRIQNSKLRLPPAIVFGIGFGILAFLCAMQAWAHDFAPRANQDDKNKELVEKGKKAYEAYTCRECHGRNGEGTDDAPDLTTSHLNSAEVSKFLQRPSADADAKGMPIIPADSPDLEPLVAYVMSLRKPPPKQP